MTCGTVLWVVMFSLLFVINPAFANVDLQRFNGLDVLNSLNYYRCMHGTPPLVWDNGLAASAQEWAYSRQQTANCFYAHSGYPGLGENVASGTYNGQGGVNYYESDFHVQSVLYHETWVYGASTPAYNHFSQIVWRDTSRVGCAWVSCPSAQYEFWVCQYAPAGNLQDVPTINANVPLPCRTSATCQFVLRNMDLTRKFSTTGDANTALAPNGIDPTTFNFGGQTCGTPLSAYVANTAPICPTNSTVLPTTIDVTITNPSLASASTPVQATIKCSNGGSGAISCNSGNQWNLPTSCPTSPPPPPAGQRCWGPLQSGYLSGYPTGYTPTSSTLSQAQQNCATYSDCGGVTSSTQFGWELRKGPLNSETTTGEISYLYSSNNCGSSTPSPSPPPSATSPPVTPKGGVGGGKCFGSLLNNTYLFQYPSGYTPGNTTLSQAQALCAQYVDCNGITGLNNVWQLRQGSVPMTSNSGEQSELVVACAPATLGQVSISITNLNFNAKLNAYIMGPKQKNLKLTLAAEILSDVPIDPTGRVSLQDSMQGGDPTVLPTTSAATIKNKGHCSFTMTYGPKKAGYHQLALSYSGDDNYLPLDMTITVLFYHTPTVGHFVISSTPAVGSTVNFYNPTWSVLNMQPTVPDFYGLLNDTTLVAPSLICTRSVGAYNAPSSSAYTVGQYIGAYAMDTVTVNAAGKFKGTVKKVAIIQLPALGANTVSLDAPGTGEVVAFICPKPGSF